MKVLLIILAVFLLLIFLLFLYMQSPQFGGRIKRKHKELYKRSRQWNGNNFDNSKAVDMDVGITQMPHLIRKMYFGRIDKMPSRPIPVVPLERERFLSNTSKPKFIWYGHSVLLLQIAGKNFLIDPMFGQNASPTAPVATPRFSMNTLALIDNLPPIDAVFLTHDHYDHLDFASFKVLKHKVRKFYVAMGAARHLERWGVNPQHIREFDWWEEMQLGNILIAFTPNQHFSGRGFNDRTKSLWGGWVFKTETHSIYWSGDGGYEDHFKAVGEKYGPFDWGFMECGQYYKLWKPIHLFPEQTAKAAIDAQVKLSIPVHWGGFALAPHPWKDPIQRFVKASRESGIKICTPQIGELVVMGDEPKSKAWWEEY
ncbi:MAG: MBL fold metallo-hydrolase [Bacteroidetes bacterium]|nr:MBL fold metallo-hydrolase [Bacteroidota bacterium]